jgi:hypothetical protein
MLRSNVLEYISAGTSVRFGSFRAGMMQLVSKHIQQLSLALGHHCSLVVTQWEAVNGSILAKAGVSVKRKKDTLIPTQNPDFRHRTTSPCETNQIIVHHVGEDARHHVSQRR